MNFPRARAESLSFTQPTAVEPMFKARTAKAPALTVPPPLLAIAGEVIE
jgi:hypothetical protein